MSLTDARPGRRLTIRQMMLAIGAFALVLAPVAEAVQSPTPGRIALALVIDLFVVPVLIAFEVTYALTRGSKRRKTLAASWVVLALIGLSPVIFSLGILLWVVLVNTY